MIVSWESKIFVWIKPVLSASVGLKTYAVPYSFAVRCDVYGLPLPLLTLLYLLSRCKWNGKRHHPHIASTFLRERSYRSAQEDPRCRLRRHLQSRVGQTKAPTAKPRQRGKEGKSKCEINFGYSVYETHYCCESIIMCPFCIFMYVPDDLWLYNTGLHIKIKVFWST